MVDFGEKLKTLRKEKGLTQLQLAERLGITKSVISAYESSSRYPSYDVLISIARIFGVTTDYLLGLGKGRTIDVTGLMPEELEVVSKMVAVLKSKNGR
jgi:Predicted transcriptional regulators